MNYGIIICSLIIIYILIMFSIIEPLKLFYAFWIIAGLCLLSKMFWMCIYEFLYYKGAGNDYLQHGKKYVKRRYKSGKR